MVVPAFVKMCKIKQLIPNRCNVESLRCYIAQIITPMTNEEYTYFEEEKMVQKTYDEDQNPERSKINPKEGTPGLLFHEFIILLALIALNGDQVTVLDDATEQIEFFFYSKLGFEKVPNSTEEEKEAREAKFKTFDQYLKKAQLAAEGKIDYDDKLNDEFLSDEDEDSFDDHEPNEQQKAFKEFLMEQAIEEEKFNLDFDLVLDLLDENLPAIPGKPTVQQINPPPYKLPIRIEYGKLMTDPDGDGKKKKKNVQKAPARKKDDKPARPIQWAPAPPPDAPSTMEMMNRAQAELM